MKRSILFTAVAAIGGAIGRHLWHRRQGGKAPATVPPAWVGTGSTGNAVKDRAPVSELTATCPDCQTTYHPVAGAMYPPATCVNCGTQMPLDPIPPAGKP